MKNRYNNKMMKIYLQILISIIQMRKIKINQTLKFKIEVK